MDPVRCSVNTEHRTGSGVREGGTASLWVQPYRDVDDLRAAVTAVTDLYNREWLIEKNGHCTPNQSYQGSLPFASQRRELPAGTRKSAKVPGGCRDCGVTCSEQ